MKANTKSIVITALLAALVCVATMSIRIPTPSTGGYIHPGDALVILSGIILGPTYGFLAAGIGSALADLLGGFFIYVPITLFAKGLVALFSGLIYKKMEKNNKSRYLAVFIGGIIDILFVAFGYFFYESFLYGVVGAVASIPANLVQGLGGLLISMALYPPIITNLRPFFYESNATKRNKPNIP